MRYRTIIINLGLYIKLKKLMSNFVHFCPILPLFLGVGQNWTKKTGQNWTLLDKIGQKLGKFLELFRTSPTNFFEKKVGQNWTKLDKN